MPEVSLWQIFASLGVPGLALGVMYMLYKKFNWKFEAVPSSWVGPIVVLFLVLIFAIVLTALVLWGPNRYSQNNAGKPSAMELSEAERTLSFAPFQFLEVKFLDEADDFISRLASKYGGAAPGVERVQLLSEILRHTLTRETGNKAEGLIERFRRGYKSDQWIAFLDAAAAYHRLDYSKCSEILDGYKNASEFPGAAGVSFFRGVCALRLARGQQGEKKVTTLQLAAARFHQSYEAAQKSTSQRYRAFASASASYFKGIVEFYKGDLNGAKKLFQTTALLASDEMRARALNGEGFILFVQGDLEAAELVLLKSLEYSSDFPYAKSNYGYVLLALNRMEAATQVFSSIASDKKIERESHRDTTLARISLAYAMELQPEKASMAADEYAAILKGLGFRDFIGVTPKEMRLARLCNELAGKVYTDQFYYGLEIFAAAYYSKAILLAWELPAEAKSALSAEVMKEAFMGLRGVLLTIQPGWFGKQQKSPLFQGIQRATKILDQVNRLPPKALAAD